MLAYILSESTRGLAVANPKITKHDRAENAREFYLIRTRIHADLCRCMILAEEVELVLGLTDTNHQLVEQIREIHDAVFIDGRGQ
jgi:hypothetical protein